MNNSRRNFIRLIGLATTCAIVAPAIPTSLLTPAIKEGVTKVTIQAKWLKISRVMLDDTPALRAFIKEHGLRLSNNDPDWERKTQIQMGYSGNDFMRNIMTVKLEYKQVLA